MTEVDCPSCEGSGETPTQDNWSYGGAGRSEGHYTTGGDPCKCCKGSGKVDSESSHDNADGCWEVSEPPEPDDDHLDTLLGDPERV